MGPPPQSNRTQWDSFYPKTVPVFLRPGPDMQECETPMSACTLAAPSRVWDKAWPSPNEWCGRSGGCGTRPGRLEGLALALGANSLDKGTGTWARDVLLPERRQAGTAGPLFQC